MSPGFSREKDTSVPDFCCERIVQLPCKQSNITLPQNANTTVHRGERQILTLLAKSVGSEKGKDGKLAREKEKKVRSLQEKEPSHVPVPPQPLPAIPEETARVARCLHPKGNFGWKKGS